MTAAELRRKLDAKGSRFFSRENMKFAGDSMSNYYVLKNPTKITTYSGDTVKVWVLTRRKPVKGGLQANAYFDVKTLSQRYPRR